jgi:DNA-binding CsgD family transcriptional regulator
MTLRAMTRRIGEGSTLAELARLVTDESRALFDADSAAIELHVGGAPHCVADSCPWVDDADLAAYGRFAHRHDPLLARLLATHRAAVVQEVVPNLVAYRRIAEETLGHALPRLPWASIAPLVGCGDLAGAVRIFRDRRFPRSLLADLAVVSAHLSTTCVRLGLDRPPLPRLTARQAQVAALARAGYTNHEMSDELGISLAAVKKHLAQLFDRLAVTNRAELAALTARQEAGPEDGARHRIRITSCGPGVADRPPSPRPRIQ